MGQKFAIDLFGGLLTLDCMWWIVSAWRIRRFLQSTPRLETADDLRRFQGVTSQCSYCNILFGITLALAFGVYIVAIFSGMAHPDEFNLVFFLGILRIGISSIFVIDLESRLIEMPAATEELRAAHEAIVQKWAGK